MFLKKSTAYNILLKLRKLFYGDLNNKYTEYVDKNNYFVGDLFCYDCQVKQRSYKSDFIIICDELEDFPQPV